MTERMDYACAVCGYPVNGPSGFCMNCGSPLERPATSSEYSGTDPARKSPLSTSKFCAGCGIGLVASSAMCPSCGTAVGGMGRSPTAKNKTVAIVLAVIFGGWAWLYLYTKCSKKFWIFIATFVALFAVAIIVWVSFFTSIISQCGNQPNCQPNFGFVAGPIIVIFILSFVQLGFHIWSIVDVATKDQSWYDSY